MATPYRKDAVQRLSDEDDLFAHRDYAAALMAAIQEVPSPFTLGLFAPWGAGKSSILSEVGARVSSHEEMAYAYFDVWRYEGDSLRREFIRDVAVQLKESKALGRGFDLEQHTERFDSAVTETQRSQLTFDRKGLARGSMFAIGAAVLVLAVLWLGPKLGLSVNHAQSAALLLSTAFLTFVLTAASDVIRADPVTVTRPRLEAPDEFAASFRELFESLKRRRLVIGVDNLDRCTPNRVAELLATIKTFLEPTVVDKELIFIIAADDAALRRHLIAQELAESGGSAIAQQPDDPNESAVAHRVPREVQDAVDEYLRKFFNGSLRVVEVLDEDIRDFARRQLADFSSRHKLSKEAAGQLVELIGSALKRNPRRIKQFINNVELRLQILEQRRVADRIQLKVDPLVVAKLSIIEEQWPERYGELCRDPRLLQNWHRDAADGDSDESPDVRERDPDWAVFLRLTETIRPADPRPYLTLKQSTRELRLPGYREFVDTLEAGDLDGVVAFLQDDTHAGTREDYIDIVPALFAESVQRGFYGAANNIVRAVIGVPALGAYSARVLAAALPHPAVRRRLTELSPEGLLAATEGLGATKFDQVAALLLGKLEATGDGSGGDRFIVSEALASRLDRISQKARARIMAALSVDEIRRDFGSYLPLALVEPDLLSEGVIGDATQALESSTPFDADEPAYQVARSKLASLDEPAPTDIQRLGSAVVESLFALMTDEQNFERYVALAADAGDLVEGFDVPQALFSDAVVRFNNEWPQIPEVLRPAAYRFVGALLDASAEGGQDEYAAIFTDRFFEAPELALSASEEAAGRFGRAYESAVERRLALLASGAAGVDLGDRTAALLIRLPREQSARVMAQAILESINNGRYDRAGTLLTDHADLVGEFWPTLVDQLLAVAEQNPSAEPPGLLSTLAHLELKRLSAEQLQRFAEVLAQAFIHNHSQADDAFGRAATTKVFQGPARHSVSRVFDHVSGNQEQIVSLQTQIAFLVREQARLTESQRFQLATMLVERIELSTNRRSRTRAVGATD